MSRKDRGGRVAARAGFSATLGGLATAVVEACWLVALATVPVYFNLYSERSFDADKVALLKVLVVVLATAWAVVALTGVRTQTGAGGTPDPVTPAADRRRRLVLLAGPIAAVLATTVVSTALSVSPERSWQGSYFRQQGVVSLLAYLAVAAAAFAFLRSAAQWRRARLAILLGSIPVCTYALAQRLGLDPLAAGPERVRTASTFGNPVFLGAYLALVLFVTLEALTSSTESDAGGDRRSGILVRRRLALGGVLALQVLALVLSQSRGPVLGVLAGLAVLALAGSLRRRQEAGGWWARWSWSVVLGGMLAGGGLLIVLAIPGSPLAGMRDLPTVGRLATALDPASRSSRVRVMAWQGVVDLVTTAPPLGGPDGAPDLLGGARLWVGYGPDTFDLAFNRVFPERLGTLEQRHSVPDRAHNELFDTLVHTGLLGLAAWVALLAALLAAGTVWTMTGGLAPGSLGLGLGAIAAGGVAGTAVALLARRADLVGVLASAGLVTGVAAAVLVVGLRRRHAGEGPGAAPALAAVLLATLTCHVVEVSVGIPMTGSRMLFFFLAALLAAGILGRWREDRVPSSGGRPGPSQDGGRWGDLGAAATAGTVLATATFSLLLSKPLGVGGEARGAWWEFIAVSERGAWGIVLVLGLGVVAALAILGTHGAPGKVVAALSTPVLLLALAPPAAAGALKVYRMAGTAELQRRGASPEAVMDQVAGHPLAFLVLVLALTALVAGLLPRPPGSDPGPRTHGRRTALILAALVLVPGLPAAYYVLRPIRADILLKQGLRVVEQGKPAPADVLFRRAHHLAPREVAPLRGMGRAAVLAAPAAPPSARPQIIAEGRNALEQAILLQPLDPDHHVNLGRLLASVADLAPDPGSRRLHLEQAATSYRRGIALRPGSVLFRTEYAGILGRLGDLDGTVAALQSVLAVDPGYDVAATFLARIERSRAVTWARQGRDDLADEHLDRALRALRNLLAHQAPGEAHQDDVPGISTAPDSGPQSPEMLAMQALLHLARGEAQLALEAAARGVGAASAAERAQAQMNLELVRRRAAGSALAAEPSGAP